MKKLLIIFAVATVALIGFQVTGFADSINIEFYVDALYYDEDGSTEVTVDFDGTHTPYFTGPGELLTNMDPGMTNSDDDVNTGEGILMLKRNRGAVVNEEDETWIDNGVKLASYSVEKDTVGGRTAVFFEEPEYALNDFEMLAISIASAESEIYFALEYDMDSGNLQFFLSDENDNEYGSETIAGWQSDKDLAMMIVRDSYASSSTANVSAYYNFYDPAGGLPDWGDLDGWTTAYSNIALAWESTGTDLATPAIMTSFSSPSSVPEPSTMVLVLLGICGLGWRMKKKK